MPDMKEKLVDVFTHLDRHIQNRDEYGICYTSDFVEAVETVLQMLKNGVTVQDGKPLEEFLHPIDAYKGLKAKYLVFKADTGKVIDNCFILRPDKDAAAVEALRAYANATDNKTLAEDIYSWVGKGEQVQEWISVKDRLPENMDDRVLVLLPTKSYDYPIGNQHIDTDRYRGEYRKWVRYGDKVTHWMPLPQPPKGE